MFYILDIGCESANFLKIILLVKNGITILQIAVPLLLIVSLMVDAFKNVTDKEGFNSKILKKMIFKILAAALVYLAPAIVNLMLSLFSMEPFQKNDCWKNANQEYIDSLKQTEYEEEEIVKDLTYIEQQLKDRHDLDEELKQNVSSGSSSNTGGNKNGEKLNYTDFPFYLQSSSSKWGGYPYCGGGRTMASSGCGAFSFSVIASGIVSADYTPDVIAKWMCSNTNAGQGNGTPAEIFSAQKLAGSFGLKSSLVGTPGQAQMMKSLLKLTKNNGMIVNVPNHYIVVVRSNSGKYGVIDSARPALNHEYTFEELWNTIFVNYAGRGYYYSSWILEKK